MGCSWGNQGSSHGLLCRMWSICWTARWRHLGSTWVHRADAQERRVNSSVWDSLSNREWEHGLLRQSVADSLSLHLVVETRTRWWLLVCVFWVQKVGTRRVPTLPRHKDKTVLLAHSNQSTHCKCLSSNPLQERIYKNLLWRIVSGRETWIKLCSFTCF